MKAVPSSYEMVSQRKGFKRYFSPQLRELVERRAEAIEAKEAALAGIYQARPLTQSPFTSNPVPQNVHL